MGSLGFRVGKGVRVYSRSGRIAGVSVGRGSLRYYQPFHAGGRSGPSVASHERQVRQAQRTDELQGAMALEQQMIKLAQAHREEFQLAQEPRAPDPDPVDTREVKQRLEAEALQGISLFKLGERRGARRRADERVEEEVRAEQSRRSEEAKKAQSELDEAWERLVANDPEVVLASLEKAFEDNESPAAAVSCRDGRVDVVMQWPAIDSVVPDRKPAVTPSGNPTLHKRNKGERASLYMETLCSHVLSTIKETFAVCPGIQQAGLAAIRQTLDPARGDQVVEPLLLVTVARQQLVGLQWEKLNPTAALLEMAQGRIAMKGKGSNTTLFSLDLDDLPEEQSFIEHVANGLGARVSNDGVPGIQLPVQVSIQV